MKIRPEEDAPFLLNMSAIQRVYQNVDVDGEANALKLRASQEFRDKFNGVVYALLERSIQNAVEDDRTTIRSEDLPDLMEI